MKKIRIAAAFSVAVASALLLTSCWGSSAPTKSSPPKPSASASAGTISVAPVPTTTKEFEQSYTADGFLKQALAQFPNVAAQDSYPKAEVARAVYSAYLYGKQATSTLGYLDGTWQSKQKFAPGIAFASLGQFFTEDAFGKYYSLAEKIATDQTSAKEAFAVAPYFPASKDYTFCPNYDCQVAGYPQMSTVTYQEVTDGSLLVKFSLTNRFAVRTKGETGYLPVTTNYSLNMVKNPNYHGKTGEVPYVINGWSNTYERSSFVAL